MEKKEIANVKRVGQTAASWSNPTRVGSCLESRNNQRFFFFDFIFKFYFGISVVQYMFIKRASSAVIRIETLVFLILYTYTKQLVLGNIKEFLAQDPLLAILGMYASKFMHMFEYISKHTVLVCVLKWIRIVAAFSAARYFNFSYENYCIVIIFSVHFVTVALFNRYCLMLVYIFLNHFPFPLTNFRKLIEFGN